MPRNVLLVEQLEILRRIAERGKKLAEDNNTKFLDLFIHLLDEIERTKGYA